MTDFVKLMSKKSELFRVMNDTAIVQGELKREEANDHHGQSYSYFDDESLKEIEREESIPEVKYWTMAGNRKILITDMDDRHLKNTINCLIRPNGLTRCRQDKTFQALEYEANRRGLRY